MQIYNLTFATQVKNFMQLIRVPTYHEKLNLFLRSAYSMLEWQVGREISPLGRIRRLFENSLVLHLYREFAKRMNSSTSGSFNGWVLSKLHTVIMKDPLHFTLAFFFTRCAHNLFYIRIFKTVLTAKTILSISSAFFKAFVIRCICNSELK